jgi:hypothetical protein
MSGAGADRTTPGIKVAARECSVDRLNRDAVESAGQVLDLGSSTLAFTSALVDAVGGEPGVTIGDKFLPTEVTMTATGADRAPDVTARFALIDGIPDCVSFVIEAKPDGRAVRTSDLREWTSLETLAANAFAQFGMVHQFEDETGRPLGAVRPESELEQVAKIYKEAIDGKPTRAVAVRMNMSHRTAGRRIAQARAAGLLPRTTAGKKLADKPEEKS